MPEDDLRALQEAAEALESGGMDLVLRSDSAEAAREQIERAREEAQRVQRRVQAEVIRRKRELERQQEKIKRELEAIRAETEKALGPVRAFMRQLEEGLWMVDLYLGTQEQILTLRDGEPADREEPLTVRQLVLAMDEECAVAAEKGGIDSIDIDQFDKWLRADQAHVEQVIPERKGVVALVPRWQPGKEYDDPWKTAEAEKANKQTYFLIRNGEQLYRIWTNFRAGRLLVPARETFTDFFWKGDPSRKHRRSTHEREALRPGTKEWAEAEDAAEAEQRHYMRVQLIFQGLIDRTTVWHPRPDGLSFLDEEAHERGLVRFVYDGQDDRLIGTGREPYAEWRDRLTAGLRPGMRVIVAPNGVYEEGWYLKGEQRSQSGRYNPRLFPSGINDLPPEGALLQVEERDAEGFLICRFKRTEEVYDPGLWVESKTRPGWGHRGGYHVPKTRATLKIKPGDWWVLPYDLATREEMEVYLRARLDRRGYVRMFPVLKSAIAAKKAEEVEEAPFVRMLEGVLARENGGTVEEARERIPALVRWYKLANRHHRALKDDDALAVRQIVAEDARRRREAVASGSVVEELRYVYEDAMLVARQRGSGKYVVLEPMEDGDDVYARRVLYGVRSGPTEDTEWWKPEPHIVSRWQVLWSSERWSSWNVGAVAKNFLTGPERDRLVEGLVEWAREHRCHSCKGEGTVREYGYGKAKDARKDCDKCGATGTVRHQVLAVTRERPQDASQDWGALMLWRIPDRKDDRDDAAVGRKFSWRRDDDGTAVLPRRAFLAEDNWNRIASYGRGYFDRGEEEMTPEEERQIRAVRRDPLWIDREAVERREAQLERRRRAEERRQKRDAEVYPYSRAIEDQRRERGQAAHVRAFVERYEYEELYEGHMKAHPAERYEHEGLDGLHKAIRAALDAGILPDGLTLGEVWPDAPEEDRGLRFPTPEAEEDPAGGEPVPEQEESELDYDFEAEVVEEVMELEAGEVVEE